MGHTAIEAGPTFLDDVVETLLEGWSGLRLYLQQRRAGSPADPVMETLLSELLRVNLNSSVDVRQLMAQLTSSKRQPN